MCAFVRVCVQCAHRGVGVIGRLSVAGEALVIHRHNHYHNPPAHPSVIHTQSDASRTVGRQRVVDCLVARGAIGGAPRHEARVRGAEGVEDLGCG